VARRGGAGATTASAGAARRRRCGDSRQTEPRLVGKHRNRQAGTETLAEHDQRPATQSARTVQPVQTQLHILERSRHARLTIAQAVTAIVEQQNIESTRWQPANVHQVSTDVLGVAVQEIHGAQGFLARSGQPPAVHAFTVRVNQYDVLICQALIGRILHPLGLRQEKQAARAATCLQYQHRRQYQARAVPPRPPAA